FIMKDAYSFDVNEEDMEKNYKVMYAAYCRIFERCGLPYIPVEADSGLMGGGVSHEFMVPSEIGEDRIIICSSCGYAASTEIAACREGKDAPAESRNKIKEVDTPSLSTVQDVGAFLKVTPSNIIKTLIYVADGEPIAVLVRGDHEANEAKIKNQTGSAKLELADPKKIEEVTKGAVGFSGPRGLTIKIFADKSVQGVVDAVTGANKKDKHLINVNAGRDFNVDKWIDARHITADDSCPKCGKEIEIKTAIEVGHTFKLGTKYSSKLGAKFLDKEGKEHFVIMGCYGIGVNRILASLIETSYDKDGIIWPLAISPCQIAVIPVKIDDENIKFEAERIYNSLKNDGIDVIIDDRDRTAGVKFKDADLVGFPIQVIIGKKSLDVGNVEVKDRAKKETVMVSKDKVVEYIKAELKVSG
ncbi:MAG: proline--tRNA ligase, partial [Candidatus Omnitrophica bacterium]|nr:proline--tRNA ligase [Candidatus Omnitrophota bacterium]